jgi:sortase A
MRKVAGRPVAAVLFTAVFFIGLLAAATAVHAAWIPLKAKLAQGLLQRSWEMQKNGKDMRPWPWADTHAIARLQIPRLAIEQIVLEGSSGRNLAFGPTLAEHSLRMQDWVINGHRDTHFRFLQELQAGDQLRLETAAGMTAFRVDTLEVIDSRDFDLVLEPGLSRLSLVTCYPFDATAVGGPLRYVVTALPVIATDFNPPAVSSD